METIDFINFILGVFFISLGFLIYKNTSLIAGYNTMSKNERDNFNIKGFQKVMRSTFISGGIFVIIGDLMFCFLSWNTGKVFLGILPGLVLPLYLVYRSKHFEA